LGDWYVLLPVHFVDGHPFGLSPCIPGCWSSRLNSRAEGPKELATPGSVCWQQASCFFGPSGSVRAEICADRQYSLLLYPFDVLRHSGSLSGQATNSGVLQSRKLFSTVISSEFFVAGGPSGSKRERARGVVGCRMWTCIFCGLVYHGLHCHVHRRGSKLFVGGQGSCVLGVGNLNADGWLC
jgi:hypothetical protein